MKIPKQLKIGGHQYKIVLEKDLEKTTALYKNPEALAQTDRTKGTITIDGGLMQSEQEACLFHEIFHVMNTVMGHELLDSFSQQLYQVLKDNNLLK